MAQHLRIGSVINFSTRYTNALVTNITNMYLEIEYTDPSTLQVVVKVISWTAAGDAITVVTD